MKPKNILIFLLTFTTYLFAQSNGEKIYNFFLLANYVNYEHTWAGTDLKIEGLYGGSFEISYNIKNKNFHPSIGIGYVLNGAKGKWNYFGDTIEGKISNLILALKIRYIFGFNENKNLKPFLGIGLKYIDKKEKITGTTSLNFYNGSIFYNPESKEHETNAIFIIGLLYKNLIFQFDIISPSTLSGGVMF